MDLRPYRDVLAIPRVRQALLLGVLVRTPIAASFIVLTLHVVTALHRTYGEAGVVTAASTIAVAVAGPWRGRIVDRRGLRRAFVPSLVVTALVWAVAPFLGFLPLIALVVLAGLFQIPVWGVIRQMILHAAPAERHRSALSLDSVATEIAFMVGPAVGVLAATRWDTRVVLLVVMGLVVLGGALIALVDPPLAHEDEEGAQVATREWLGPAAAAVLAMTIGTTLILSGTDVSVVALMKDAIGDPDGTALVMALWAGGSLVGGLLYGAINRPAPAAAVLAGLGLLTLPVGLARTTTQAAWLVIGCGLLCAPMLTITAEKLAEIVPARARGEAMGWHGSAITSGSAVGAPLAGVAIDHVAPAAGFVAVGASGVLVALLASAAMRAGRRRAV